MFATITNRGSQLIVDSSRQECQRVADEINARGGELFAWVQEVPKDTVHDDMPGRGVWHG